MKSRLERYRVCAVTCAATDYGSPASVRQHNRAVDEMRRLVAESGASEELLPLLAEPDTQKWLAFQLLELGGLPATMAQECLAVIVTMAAGVGGEALGARMWLREQKHY